MSASPASRRLFAVWPWGSADEPGVNGAVAAGPDGVLVAQRVKHRPRPLHGCALAHRHRMRAHLGVVGEVAVREVRPPRGRPDELDLRVALGPPEPRHPRLRLHVDERRQRRALVAHHARRAVGVGEHALDAQFRKHPRGGLDRATARVVEVVVDRIDPVVLADALDLQSRDGHRHVLVGHRQHDRPLGLDVREPGEVLDARRVEPDAGVRVAARDPVADLGHPGLERRRRQSRRHTPHQGSRVQKRSVAGSRRPRPPRSPEREVEGGGAVNPG